MRIGTNATVSKLGVESCLDLKHQDSGHLCHIVAYVMDAPEYVPIGSTYSFYEKVARNISAPSIQKVR